MDIKKLLKDLKKAVKVNDYETIDMIQSEILSEGSDKDIDEMEYICRDL